MRRSMVVLSLLALAALPGCATLNQLATLQKVSFAFDRVSEVRVAGVRVSESTKFSDLGIADAAKLAAAIASKRLPLEAVAHVSATNPTANGVNVRMVEMPWTLFVQDRRALDGGIAAPVAIAAGATSDVPLTLSLDLMQLANGGARELFDLARGIAGPSGTATELRLELRPSIETPIGPIGYPAPVVVRRTLR